MSVAARTYLAHSSAPHISSKNAIDPRCSSMVDVWPPHVDGLSELESLRARCAELERQLAERDWQPIETAPKDGLPVLVGWDNAAFHPIVAHEEDAQWGYLNDDFSFSAFNHPPTHWRHLPSGPKSDAGRRSDDPKRKTEAASS